MSTCFLLSFEEFLSFWRVSNIAVSLFSLFFDLREFSRNTNSQYQAYTIQWYIFDLFGILAAEARWPEDLEGWVPSGVWTSSAGEW